MNSKTIQHLFKMHKEHHLFGRSISGKTIEPLLKIHGGNFTVEKIGRSVLGIDIEVITIGNGPKKILMWSQMHGNESTTTKAVFDLCNTFANSKSQTILSVLESCTIAIIPMLNPDGAEAYTRANANGVDLNRDAQELTQPESRALRAFFEAFKPDFCFNLHCQRTIFSAGRGNHPASVSFLAPAQDEICSITSTRKKAMEIIVKMNDNLQQQIPNQVGIYDDAFNINCVGDMFQSLNTPTVLFEAGHYTNDYDREVVREFIYQSLVVAIHHIASAEIYGTHYEGYFAIPQNHKLFYDIIIRNAKVEDQNVDIAFQFKELLENGRVEFVPVIEEISNLTGYFAHREVNAHQKNILTADGNDIYVGYENDFVLLNNEKFLLKP